jgi:hypothetical protein
MNANDGIVTKLGLVGALYYLWKRSRREETLAEWMQRMLPGAPHRCGAAGKVAGLWRTGAPEGPVDAGFEKQDR